MLNTFCFVLFLPKVSKSLHQSNVSYKNVYLCYLGGFSIIQFSSVTQLCPTLCDHMNCSTPGLLVQNGYMYIYG